MRVYHTIAPVWDTNCRVLILGSFPSVASRENAFFYGHPQNRFWKMLSGVYGESCPSSVEEKRALLLRHHIALWDSLESCEIRGSSDATIRSARLNDLSPLLRQAPILRILFHGTAARDWYLRLGGEPPLPYETMPSTSPANARYTLPMLIARWRVYLP